MNRSEVERGGRATCIQVERPREVERFVFTLFSMSPKFVDMLHETLNACFVLHETLRACTATTQQPRQVAWWQDVATSITHEVGLYPFSYMPAGTVLISGSVSGAGYPESLP